MLKTFTLLFFLFSSSSFADTYPAQSSFIDPNTGIRQTSLSPICVNLSAQLGGTYIASGSQCCKAATSSSGAVCYSYSPSFYCPAGGFVSDTTCIDAPVCVAPQVRNSTTAVCQTPPTCIAPAQYDNPTNSCITSACPTGQSRLPAPDYTCVANSICPAIIPMCASTAYDCNNADGTQQHISLCSTVCPIGQHLVGNNCVDNKIQPINCPSGFIAKDGDCIAADPVACPVGTRSGKINGDHVCVGSGNTTPFSPQETHNTGTQTGTHTTTTITKDAVGNITGTSVGTTTDKGTIDLNTTGLASESTQKGILNALIDKGPSDKVKPADTSSLDTALDTSKNQLSITDPGSYFIQTFVVLPTEGCQTVPFHYKLLQYDFDPCTKLQTFRDLMGYFFYIITAIFIYQTATRPAGD